MASPISRLIGFASLVALAGLAALFFLLREGQTAAATGSVQVTGSESMRPVVAACAEEFMTKNPKADVIVKGGGSGDGVAAILHGIADIGMMSRDLSQRERDYAASKGIELVEHQLARDGVTVIVNRASKVAALDLDQLARHLLRKDPQLARAGRRRCGDHRVCARDRFGHRIAVHRPRAQGCAYAASVTQLPTNEAIVAEVAARAGGIGYTSLGALQDRAQQRQAAGAAHRRAAAAGHAFGGRGPFRPLSAGANAASDRTAPLDRHGERVRRLLPEPCRSGAGAQGRLHRHRQG